MRIGKLLAGAAILSGIMIGPAFAQNYHFKLLDKIALPTKPGHGDWVAYDPSNQYVYVSLNGSGMAVVDTKTNKLVKNFADIPSPNVMTFDSDYVYETAADGPGAGKTNQIFVIDKKTWQVVDRVTTKGTSPDGIFMDPNNNEIYVTMDDNNDIEVYSSGAHPVLKRTIALYPAKPKSGPDVNALYDGTVYATDDSWVLKINPTSGAITKKHDYHLKLTKQGGTKGMYWDKDHHNLWVSTTSGGVLVVNPKTLALERKLPETKGADAVAWDNALGLVYIFEGATPGFDVYSAKTMKRLTTVKTGTAKPSHSGAVDTSNHNVYVYAGGDAALDVYKPMK